MRELIIALLAFCIRARVIYDDSPHIIYESWPRWSDGAPGWQEIGASVGSNVSHFTEMAFWLWTPVPVRGITSGLWGTTIAWTSEKDIQVRYEFLQECVVRTLLPIIT